MCAPSRESRTVSVLRGSSGCATGYSEPPMWPVMRWPKRNFVGLCGKHDIAAQ